VCVWAWRYTHRNVELPAPQVSTVPKGVVTPKQTPALESNDGDVATEIAALPKHTSDSYAEATVELVSLANDARKLWPDDRKQVFDGKLAELQHAVDGAVEGRPRQKAYRTLIRYLQRVTTRDEVAFADGVAP
jgi:hypothetical protein